MLRSVQRNYWIFRQLMAKLHLITYGCQMNEYDSELVTGLLRAERYELTADEQEADLILVNTCAIREKAEEKVFSKLGELRKLKTKNPELIIGVMGCMAQLQQEAIQQRVPAVDLVFGSPAIARVGELVERVRRERRPVLETGEGPLVKITVRPPSASRLKAFVTVMEGCEKHCTFCVVPRTRGRERSHPPETLLAEVRSLVAEGCREVTLLGQTVNAYGRDLTPPTDLIVGFPGETEADFEQTLDMVEQVGYDNVFVFRYSRRPGTPAAAMPDQVADEVKARRNARLLEVAGRVAAERSRALVGRTLDVLVDGASKKNAGELSGRTRCNRVVNFDGQGRVSSGDVTRVRVTEVLPHSLRGTLAAHAEETPCLSK